jgi:hypothetical protein
MAKSSKAGRRLFERLGTASGSNDVFTGMIKPADDDDSILFARAGDCSRWVKLPADHIADVKFLHTVNCKDHTHPLVQIFMKEAATAEGKTFSALARLHSAPLPAMLAAHAPISHVLPAALGAREIGGPSLCWDVSRGGYVPC